MFVIVLNSFVAENAAPPAVTLPPGLIPMHKASIMMFLERVYGIEQQATFFRILEDAILPDLRAATTLDNVGTQDGQISCRHIIDYCCTFSVVS
jgi:ryanodine receptor 2